jgi:uncharacterized protein YxeA
MKKLLIGIAIVIAAIVVAYFVFGDALVGSGRR